MIDIRLPHAHIVFRLENSPDHRDLKSCVHYIEEHISTIMPTTPILDGHKTDCTCTQCKTYRTNNICVSCSQTPCEPKLECTSTLCKKVRYANNIRKTMIHKCYPVENGGCKQSNGYCTRGYSQDTTTETCFDSRGFPIYKRPEKKDLMVVAHNKQIVLEVINNTKLCTFVIMAEN